MPVVFPEAIIVAILSIFLFLALCGALVLIAVCMRRPATLPLVVAAGLVVSSLVIVSVAPINVPTLMGLVIALLGTAVAVLGGNPMTRRVLEIATHGRVRDGANGGIILDPSTELRTSPSTEPRTGPSTGLRTGAEAAGTAPAAKGEEVMRGGTTIGYLERLAVVVALIAGYPEAIAIVVAIKGVGRFSELAAAEARERFIIGTMSSLLWACVVGALVRLAIW
ncbi:MAG TPA: hypothetical protein VNT50_11540 [Microbacterium sp.]|uniref:hypothetical protein n=1 Tax=Microbacterium sp. TaxID=51671 RepID=UPI002C504D66|nr:hypothetical protein [Microbacterium sp.]HWI32117.1 hypothetical protein [Microbacterium sp.]